MFEESRKNHISAQVELDDAKELFQNAADEFRHHEKQRIEKEEKKILEKNLRRALGWWTKSRLARAHIATWTAHVHLGPFVGERHGTPHNNTFHTNHTHTHWSGAEWYTTNDSTLGQHHNAYTLHHHQTGGTGLLR